MHPAGVQFGSHTVTHPQLRSLEWEMIQVEVQSSKQTIEDRLGCAVQSFSYPYAFPEADRPFHADFMTFRNCAVTRMGFRPYRHVEPARQQVFSQTIASEFF